MKALKGIIAFFVLSMLLYHAAPFLLPEKAVKLNSVFTNSIYEL